jgi:hypothetical protein
MRRRFLNVASIICCVACVALTGMWVRSYWCANCLERILANQRHFIVESVSGQLSFVYIRKAGVNAKVTALPLWRVSRWPPGPEPSGRQPNLDFVVFSNAPGGFLSQIPYWLLVLTSGSLAMLLRMRSPWRFHLRQLFIVTTFLAVVLGMIACLDRSWIAR